MKKDSVDVGRYIRENNTIYREGFIARIVCKDNETALKMVHRMNKRLNKKYNREKTSQKNKVIFPGRG